MNVYVIECLLYGDNATSIVVAEDKKSAISSFKRKNKDIIEYIDGIDIRARKINTNRPSVKNFFGGWM